MSWYLVTGRVDGDDEDSIEIIEADCVLRARHKFMALLKGSRPETSDEEIYPIYINWIVNCGNYRPNVEEGPG